MTMEFETQQASRAYAAGIPEPADTAGSIHELDAGLDRLEETIALLERTLGPVLNQYGLVEASKTAPESEPRSQLHARARRTHYIAEALHGLIQRLDL